MSADDRLKIASEAAAKAANQAEIAKTASEDAGKAAEAAGKAAEAAGKAGKSASQAAEAANQAAKAATKAAETASKNLVATQNSASNARRAADESLGGLPQFGARQLAGIAAVLIGLGAFATWIVIRSGFPMAFELDGFESSELTGKYQAVSEIARILAIAGIGAIAAGIWTQAAALRMPKADGVRTMAPSAAGGVIASLAAGLKDLKGPTAMLLVGAALLITAAYVVAGTVPDVSVGTTTTTTIAP